MLIAALIAAVKSAMPSAVSWFVPPRAFVARTGDGKSIQPVVISGTNGQSGGTYYLLARTNLALPLDQWPLEISSKHRSKAGQKKL
jgi:hypothetical protein